MSDERAGKSTKPYFVGSFKSTTKIGHILNHELPEPQICKTFGCKNILTRSEQLASDYCIKCNYDKQLKNKENIYQ